MADLEKVLVTERPGAPRDNAILGSPLGRDVKVVAMPWWKQTAIRTLRTYLQSLVGFLLAGGTGLAGAVGVPMPAYDFWALLQSSAGLALAPAVISLLQNGIEILAKLDSNNPEIRA